MRDETALQQWVADLDPSAIWQASFPQTSEPHHFHCPKMFLYQIAADPGTVWSLERLEPQEKKRRELAGWYAEARRICFKLGWITSPRDTDPVSINVEKLRFAEVQNG